MQAVHASAEALRAAEAARAARQRSDEEAAAKAAAEAAAAAKVRSIHQTANVCQGLCMLPSSPRGNESLQLAACILASIILAHCIIAGRGCWSQTLVFVGDF